MYRILALDGSEKTTADKIQFCKQQERGSGVVLCDSRDAQGIVVNDSVYHLLGLPTLQGYETVTYEESAGVADLAAYQEALAEMGVTI